jgi:hypothetical protein
MESLEQELQPFLPKEEALNQERFSEDPKYQFYNPSVRKSFFGVWQSREAFYFMTLLAFLSVCMNAVFLASFVAISPAVSGSLLEKQSVGIGRCYKAILVLP